MRSLALKLTLAFLLVGLIGAVLVAVFVQYRTQREFDRLVLDQNQQAMITGLLRYYQVNGSWQGVEAAIRQSQQSAVPPFRNPNPRLEALRALFVITDADGKVVFGKQGTAGSRLSNSDLNKGVALELDGETIGWLIFTPAIDRWRPGTPEGNFLRAVQPGDPIERGCRHGHRVGFGGHPGLHADTLPAGADRSDQRVGKGQVGLPG